MTEDNRAKLDVFDIHSLPDLDTVVLGALELFCKVELPAINQQAYKKPLVVGSGNAEATGRIIFGDTDAVFASESSFDEKLKTDSNIDGVILVSASGGKHAPRIAQTAKRYGKHITLFTNNPDSAAIRELSTQEMTTHVFPKNREPYTYNTSTYMGMILSFTKEDPKEILNFLHEDVAKITLPDLSLYTGFYLIVPPQISGIIRMLHVKFIELFGRNIARDIETSEYVRHATTIAQSNELFISFGDKNEQWGKPENRLHIPLPQNANYASMMAVGYYTIAQIQKAKPQYFKENIQNWADTISDMYGEKLDPIVPGNQ